MTKAVLAKCKDKKVNINEVDIEVDFISSEGKAESSGVLFLDKEKSFFITNTIDDLKTTLEKISGALDKIASALTAIDGKPAGTNPPSPVAASDILQIQSLKSDLDSLKDNLK